MMVSVSARVDNALPCWKRMACPKVLAAFMWYEIFHSQFRPQRYSQ